MSILRTMFTLRTMVTLRIISILPTKCTSHDKTTGKTHYGQFHQGDDAGYYNGKGDLDNFIVRIKSLLNAASITTAHIRVNAA
ncbi:hypothetical protein Tco_0368486 [Tanacetum coccineum]